MLPRDEVIKKWDKTHHAALQTVLSFVDNDFDIISIPQKDHRIMVTAQICRDFGYSPLRVLRHNGKKAFYQYKKEKT